MMVLSFSLCRISFDFFMFVSLTLSPLPVFIIYIFFFVCLLFIFWDCLSLSFSRRFTVFPSGLKFCLLALAAFYHDRIFSLLWLCIFFSSHAQTHTHAHTEAQTHKEYEFSLFSVVYFPRFPCVVFFIHLKNLKSTEYGLFIVVVSLPSILFSWTFEHLLGPRFSVFGFLGLPNAHTTYAYNTPTVLDRNSGFLPDRKENGFCKFDDARCGSSDCNRSDQATTTILSNEFNPDPR